MVSDAIPKRAVLYIRVSTDMQAQEGESLSAQSDRLRKWAKEHGYVVVGEYVDAGESARVADRREFTRMLQDAKQEPRPFDAILVWKWDRFARNMDDATIFKSLLRRQLGIELISIGDPNLGGAVGTLVERMMDVIAEFQSLLTAEHVKNTMSFLAENGRWLGKVPFGYKLENGKLMPHEEEAEAVRWAFDQVRRRQIAIFSLAEIFAQGSQFPCTVKRGYKWSPQAIRNMLRNPVYVGRVIWNRRYMTITSIGGVSKKRQGFRDESEWIVVENAHPPIIDRGTFEEVQRVLHEIGAKYARTPLGDYLYRGLVKCARCGHNLVYYAPKKGLPKLVCSQYFRIPAMKCYPMNAIRPEELEQIVLRSMEEILQRDEVPELDIAVSSSRNPAQSIELAIEHNRQRLRRLMDAYESGAYTIEEFKSRRQEIDLEYERLQEALRQRTQEEEDQAALVAALRAKVADVLAVMRGEEATVAQKNAALASVIDHIVVDKQSGSVRIRWRLD